MKIIKMAVNGGYTISIGRNILESHVVAEFCKKIAHRVVVIADENIAKRHSEKLLNGFKQLEIKCDLLTFIANEKNKSRATKERFEDQMMQLGCGRDTCIVALGGGVTTDLAGFVAATYYRGVPVVYLPTSLLAMVDASIGGKTGVNTVFGKNLIGAFYQPRAVFIDMGFLDSLPESQIKSGMGEMIKHAIIADKNYFSLFEGEIDFEKAIERSCGIKKGLVEQDEKDVGIRQILNFGHTVGHALEQASQYTLSHGEAVALGIVAESYMSLKLNLLSREAYEKIKAVFVRHQISIKLTQSLDKEGVKKALLMDKKNVEQLPRFVLIEDIGLPHVGSTGYTSVVPDDIIIQGIEAIC